MAYLKKIIGYVLVAILCTYYGMLSYRNDLFPYKQSIALYHRINPPEEKKPEKDEKQVMQDKMNKVYEKVDVESTIGIRTMDDVEHFRKKLLSLIFGSNGLPGNLPAQVIPNHADARYADLQELARIDKIVVSMDFGLESYVYHFVSSKPNNKAILYHQGHDGDFHVSKHQINVLINNGYSVFAFSMPLLGMNTQPEITVPNLGVIKLTQHGNMIYLNPPSGHRLKYFLEPVIQVVNYIVAGRNFESVSMTGISGGGWTTTLAAALDVRINKSYPVSGTYPIYLRSGYDRDWGDYEQNTPDIYSKVNYLELYILGATGSAADKRKQIQLLNANDPCCFTSGKWNYYKNNISSRVASLGGGRYDVVIDETHMKHEISDYMLDLIMADIAEK